MKIREKKFHSILLATLIFLGASHSAQAQIDLHLDTIECHIIGFNFGLKAPISPLSRTQNEQGPMADMASLYKAPFLEYGINCLYKYESGWLVSLDGNLWMGGDNLKHRMERLGSVYSRDSICIGGGGYDANVTCYNRGLSFQAGLGKIFFTNPVKNPNSGILARLYGGYMFQQTIFTCNDAVAPQISDDYALLYDHQRQGFLLTEGIGYWFMSNYSNLLNCYVELSLQQCWSSSTRDYVIDNLIGLHGKDNNKYFDMLVNLKLCWMFPLKGKQAHDIYFF
ncbi:MAG: hypothetical protein MJZ67_03270 [Bacteroidales bacterium]|nr:hypothetical protein [Bacteroidales bacterium]